MKNIFALFVLLCTSPVTAAIGSSLLKAVKEKEHNSNELFKRNHNNIPFPFGSCRELLMMDARPDRMVLKTYSTVACVRTDSYEKAIFINEESCIHLKKDNNGYIYSLYNDRCEECKKFYEECF